MLVGRAEGSAIEGSVGGVGADVVVEQSEPPYGGTQTHIR